MDGAGANNVLSAETLELLDNGEEDEEFSPEELAEDGEVEEEEDEEEAEEEDNESGSDDALNGKKKRKKKKKKRKRTMGRRRYETVEGGLLQGLDAEDAWKKGEVSDEHMKPPAPNFSLLRCNCNLRSCLHLLRQSAEPKGSTKKGK